jgi:hypothetical protein
MQPVVVPSPLAAGIPHPLVDAMPLVVGKLGHLSTRARMLPRIAAEEAEAFFGSPHLHKIRYDQAHASSAPE